jgi:hypothetical protein
VARRRTTPLRPATAPDEPLAAGTAEPAVQLGTLLRGVTTAVPQGARVLRRAPARPATGRLGPVAVGIGAPLVQAGTSLRGATTAVPQGARVPRGTMVRRATGPPGLVEAGTGEPAVRGGRTADGPVRRGGLPEVQVPQRVGLAPLGAGVLGPVEVATGVRTGTRRGTGSTAAATTAGASGLLELARVGLTDPGPGVASATVAGGSVVGVETSASRDTEKRRGAVGVPGLPSAMPGRGGPAEPAHAGRNGDASVPGPGGADLRWSRVVRGGRGRRWSRLLTSTRESWRRRCGRSSGR